LNILFTKFMNQNDIAYMAGLFDGEGCVTINQRWQLKKGKKKKYKFWNIRMEISMTDEDVIRWVHEVLKVGTVTIRRPTKSWIGKKTQWRWRCCFRDALYVAKLLWPYAQVKMHAIENIIDHYEDNIPRNVVNLEDFRHER
jgi:hypothetical protein